MDTEKKDKNLWQRIFRRSPATGQIATLITLLIAAIFLFVAITINVGRVSQKKTLLSNAADAASLQVASQVGSYAHFLSCQYLKCKKKICKFSFSMFFKWLGELAASFIIGGPWGALAYFIVSMAGMAAGYPGLSAGIEAYYWGKISRQFKKMSQKMQYTEGAILAALQRAVDDQKQVIDIYDDDEDGLKEEDGDRVPAFLQWYNERLRVIDKKIIRPQQQAIDSIKSSVQDFDAKAQAFQPFIHDPTVEEPGGVKGEFILLLEELEQCGYPLPPNWNLSFWDPGNPLPKKCEELYTPEQCKAFDDGCGGEDDDSDKDDDSEQPNADSCAACSPYDEYLANFYHDQVDSMDFELTDKHKFASDMAEQTTEDLFKNIDAWRSELYDGSPDNCPGAKDADYNSTLSRWINDLAAWKDELLRIKAQVEACMQGVNMCQACDPLTGACSYDEGLSCCCKLKDGLTLPQRIDNAIARLDAFRNDALQFQGEVAAFNSAVETIEEDNIADGQTKRNAVYSWQDTYLKKDEEDGKKEKEKKPLWHHVKVEVDKIKMPRIKTYVIDFVKCAKLKHAKQTIWVEIKRYDQGQEGYSAFKFRYHGQEKEPENPQDWRNIPDSYWLTARSHARYSYKKKPPKVVKVK